jgi:hypothetical protein
MLPVWVWDLLPAKFRRYEKLIGFDRWKLYGREEDEVGLGCEEGEGL